VMFEGAGAREISFHSTCWCSSWSVSAGMFFFDLFCGGIVSCFLAKTQWAQMLGSVRKSGQGPQTQKKRIHERSRLEHNSRKRRQNLPMTAHASKVVNPFTHALAPPFIGRRRDFCIPKIPSNLRNIP
jgi:hypothetical protein